MVATDGHVPGSARGVVGAHQPGDGRVADVDDLQAAEAIRHIRMVAADGHAQGTIRGVVGAHQPGAGRIADVDDLQADGGIRHIRMVATDGHVSGNARGVVGAHQPGAGRVADVDDLQAAALIRHIRMVAADDHVNGIARGVVGAFEHWPPLHGVYPGLPVDVPPRLVPGFEGDGIAHRAAVPGVGLVVHIGVGIGHQHPCAGGADCARGRPGGPGVGAEVQRAAGGVDPGDGQACGVAVGIAVVGDACGAYQGRHQRSPCRAAVGGHGGVGGHAHQRGGLAGIEHRAGTGTGDGSGQHVQAVAAGGGCAHTV